MLAFGEQSLFAARMGWEAGQWSLLDASRRPLPPDLLRVSPIEPNVRSVAELAHLAGETLEGVGCQGGRVAIILPDLALRAFALPLNGRLSSHQMLVQVASRLPYPGSEAVYDTWSGSPKWALLAVVRRAVLRQYEQTVEAVGCPAAWVNGASLVKIPEWTREASEDSDNGSGGTMRVHVQLYPDHYSLTVFQHGDLSDFRVKLLQHPSRLVDELVRLPTMFGGVEYRQISVHGERAAALMEELEESGLPKGRAQLGENGQEAHVAALMLAMVQSA